MGIKILAVGLILSSLGMLGLGGVPDIVTGLLILIGSIGVLAGY